MNELITYLWMGTMAVYIGTTIIDHVLKKKKAKLEQRLRGFNYDQATDIMTVGSVKFSGQILRFLADEANSGDTFLVLERSDGVLNISVTKSEEHKHVKKIVEDTLGKGSM